MVTQMNINIFLISLFLIGCNSNGIPEKGNSISPHVFTCEYVGEGTARCVNDETICYISYGRSVFCKFKKPF